MNDLTLYKNIKNYCKQGKKAVLATVVEAKGSCPRGVGAKMVILDNSAYLGTIGGGCVEGDVKKAVKKIFENNTDCSILDLTLFGEPGERNSDVCGGTMKVMLELIN